MCKILSYILQITRKYVIIEIESQIRKESGMQMLKDVKNVGGGAILS